MRNKSGRKARLGHFLLTLLVLAVIGFVGWGYIAPLLTTGSETIYESYSVQRGDILTHKSFAASINVLNSETHTNGEDVTSIRKLYVESGQQVKDGDKLLQLDTGEIFRADIDGVVNDMRFGEGDWLWPYVQIIQICDLTHLQVSLQVDEYDVDKVAVGQPCTVTIVPLGIDFETQIKHVNRLSTATGSVAYYEVTAELTVPENVLPGMTASASIADDEAHDVLTLDMAALSFDENHSPYVYVKNGESYEKRTLETGLNDGMHVEIVSGLDEGDVVYCAHEQEIQAKSFSLGSLYKRIIGEKVVINDMSAGRGGRGGMRDGIELTEGMTLPEGIELPEGMPSFDGQELPDAEGLQRREVDQQPGGGTQ